MIFVVSGKLGSGKSYHLAKLIIDHLRNGGVVATNMAIDLSEIRKIYHRHIYDWQLIKVSAASDPRLIPRGDFRGVGKRRVMVVLDEALNWFASSESKSDPRRYTWGVWLRQSDKLGQDVYFISQEFNRAAKWIRELAQVAIDIRNFGQVRLFGMPVGKWFRLGRIYIAVHVDTRTLMTLGVSPGWISPYVWQCYKTAELYDFIPSESAYLTSVAPAYRSPLSACWIVAPVAVYQFLALMWSLTRSFCK